MAHPAKCDLTRQALDDLDARLNAKDASIASLKTALTEGTETQLAAFRDGVDVNELVAARARLVDGVLLRAWQHGAAALTDAVSLCAVGGYGRSQLHPASDIDIMILSPDTASIAAHSAELADFFTLLWDIGLEVGHSVRTVDDCVREASDDVTVATALMESRLLSGDEALFETMRTATDAEHIWPSAAFFEAKLDEQKTRHERYHGTGYNLEPNIKGSPGGLRDIQMVGWVAKRHFGADTLEDLVGKGFLTQAEYDGLVEGRTLLWTLRYALHALTGRREDRLLFDHQMMLAEALGYKDSPHTLAVEQMMQRYYRTVLKQSRMNEMLLQLFDEAILRGERDPEPLNERFSVVHDNLDVNDTTLFEREPGAMLEVFYHVQRDERVQGVTARTIRAIRRCRHLIDDEFRADPDNKKLFLRIMDAQAGVTHELRRMNRYGVLGLYIPAFGRIVGRMQYDLFHAYTVDAHTLFVVSNLRRFALARFKDEYPYCSQIMRNLSRPLIIYLAGLFHDIAKGRGGDHSELGAVDALSFCTSHGMSTYDARMVSWLVRHHLDLSITAQKKDVNDPQVVNEFAALVGDQQHLDYLYLLTVADVRATNPKLFNSWKAELFEKLYRQTRRALDRGLANPISRSELIAETRDAARRILDEKGISADAWQGTWQSLGDEYFLQHGPQEVVWHTEQLQKLSDPARSLVALRESDTTPGLMLLLWYAPRGERSFARATAALDDMGLNIVDARITTTSNNYRLDTYRILDPAEPGAVDPRRLADILQQCKAAQDDLSQTPSVSRRPTRRERHFTTPTRLEFVVDLTRQRTVMEMTAADRPGLLSKVGSALKDCEVRLLAAKITTVGERAENVLFLSDANNGPLEDDACTALHSALLEHIEPNCA